MNHQYKYLVILLSFVSLTTFAQEKTASDAAELAKKLSNPVAYLISVPFQNNTDVGIGTYNGWRNTMNFQPVIPIKLNTKINLISRVVLPIISQHSITGEGKIQDGVSDALVSAFFSPAEAKNGLVWGVGPVFLVPTASNDFLGTKKFCVGPTALVLKQTNGWTIGALANQIWSVAGDDKRSDINQMYLQPFLIYNWKSGAGLGVASEITQNWEANTTNVYIIPNISGITKLGTQIVSLSIGPRIQASAPEGFESAFGIRAALTFVFPK